jgi:transposase InsO family protein
VSAFIDEHRPSFGVEPICRVLQVAPSTYYARKVRPLSARARRDRELAVEIARAREGYRGVYGVRKTWRELRRGGVDVGRERVARLMRERGWRGVQRGRRVRTTTPAETAADRGRDLVRRNFRASAPNRLWVADLTYLRSWQGVCYLAFVVDVYSRRIVGWQIATHMRSSLVIDALDMAGGLRRPAAGLVAHSDRGSQYTSLLYTDRLDELGAAPSVGSKGDAYDNALAESFVATIKSELIDRYGPWRSFEQLEHAVACWIAFYNSERLHTSLGDVPPDEFEQQSVVAFTGDAVYGSLTACEPAGQLVTLPEIAVSTQPRGPCGPAETGSLGLNRGPLPGLEAPATITEAPLPAAEANPTP